MMTLLMASFLSAPAAATEALFPNGSVEVLSRETIRVGEGTLPLALVVEAGSPWANRGTLLEHLNKSNQIFSQCGVGFGDVEIVNVRLSPGTVRALTSPNPYVGPAEVVYAGDEQLPTTRPLAFLTAQRRGYSGVNAFNLRSIPNAVQGRPPEAAARIRAMLDTVHISWDFANAYGSVQDMRAFAPSFNTFAHELAHVYGNLEHTPVPYNLMSSSSLRRSHTGDLNFSQCDAIRAYAHSPGLLPNLEIAFQEAVEASSGHENH